MGSSKNNSYNNIDPNVMGTKVLVSQFKNLIHTNKNLMGPHQIGGLSGKNRLLHAKTSPTNL